MYYQKTLLHILFVFTSFSVFAQSGSIRGTIIDESNGEPLIGATAVIEGTTTGSATDFEGTYAITDLDPGTYAVKFSYVSYQSKTVTGIVIKAGEVTPLNVSLTPEVSQLGDVVVTAELIRTSESALMTLKRKSANIQDGISSESISRIGDSDAGSAIKRVSGVSVQDGKYVFVRGLGDRYTQTVVNGMSVPGLDPDRNSLQMDLFPTNIIDNIIVRKSFTADLPADFTGGIVNIDIKDFPTEKTAKVSASVGYNPSMHFQDNYLTYDGGDTDFLGFDDGTRELPFDSQTEIPLYVTSDPGERARLTELTRSFNPIFGPTTKTSFADYSLGVSLGNQSEKEKVTLGYNLALSYKNNTTFYDNVIDKSQYIKNSNELSDTELILDRSRTGSEGTNDVLLGGLAGFALKTKASKFKLSVFHIQNGSSQANIIQEENFIFSSNRSIRYGLAYAERSITNVLLGGEHYFDASKWNIEWKLSPTFSEVNDKDVRLVPFTLREEGGTAIEPSEGGNPTRIWRFLKEVNYSGKVDFTKDLKLFSNDSKLKFGAMNTYKQRDFSIDNFNFLVRNESAVGLRGDPNNLLTPENIWTAESSTGTLVEGNYQGSNTYEAWNNTLAFYVSGELTFTERFKAILGVRAEKYEHYYTGGDQDWFNSNGNDGVFLDNEEVLSSFKAFPTANLVYNVIENSNLRVSYSRTVARPSFKEKSIAQILDPLSNTTWVGNIDLVETDIDNFDVRWEYFFNRGQTVAFSGFYKKFKNPIEVAIFDENNNDNYTAKNNGDAQVFGVEAEVRKNFDFISPALEKFSLNINASFIESQLKMNEEEYESRKLNLRQNQNGDEIEELDDTREMQGQAPYLINAGINYDNFDLGWEGGIYYNVQGSALATVGIGAIPDLYTEPFHSVNFSLKKNLGAEKRAGVSFKVSNLLDDKRQTFYKAYESGEPISSSYAPGREFSVGFDYSF